MKVDLDRFVWCLVANVSREPHPEGPDGELRAGTRNFAPGAKLYLRPSRWGDGGERMPCLGRHRGGRRLVEAVAATKHLVDWRAAKVFHPYVVACFGPYCDDPERDEREARRYAEAFNARPRPGGGSDG